MQQFYDTSAQKILLLFIMLFKLKLLDVPTGLMFLVMLCFLAIDLGSLVST